MYCLTCSLSVLLYFSFSIKINLVWGETRGSYVLLDIVGIYFMQCGCRPGWLMYYLTCGFKFVV